MKLRQAKSFGVLDDHQRGVRHVDADLDDGRRNENVESPGDEFAHDLFFFGRLHFAVQQADRVLRKDVVSAGPRTSIVAALRSIFADSSISG